MPEMKKCTEDLHKLQHKGNKRCIFCGQPIKYYPGDMIFMTDFQKAMDESMKPTFMTDAKKGIINYEWNSNDNNVYAANWIVSDDTSQPSNF